MSEIAAEHAEQRTHEEGVEADDVNSLSIAVVGLVSTALVLASALGVQALYNSYWDMLNQQRVVDTPYTAAQAALTEQENKLSRYRKPSGASTAYSVPIEEAMSIVVKEISAKQGKAASHTSE